jgi:phosphoribosylformimino-5-aminoimidazole carboxamide ribonucleotide (ProFAR) isomerase
VAGGVSSLADLDWLRAAGADGVIVGEVLFTGAIRLAEAMSLSP